VTGNETRDSLGTRDLMDLTNEELDSIKKAQVTESTWRRVVIEKSVREAIVRAKAKAGLL
jgi:hypothetical protein